MESKHLIVVDLLIGLALGGGIGYYIPQSSITSLTDELEDAVVLLEEREITITESTSLITEYEAEVSSLEDEIIDLSTEISAQNSEIEDINSLKDELEDAYLESIESFNNLSAQYLDLVQRYEDYQDYYASMWNNYNDLIQAYYNLTLVIPEGNRVVNEILGIVNGDFEAGNEGWLFQGKGGIGWGGARLHQYETFSTYLTQTINITSSRHGVAFSIQPQPLGGTISLRVSIGDTIVYEDTFSGINSDFDYTTIVIPYKYLFEMRELYELEPTGIYSLKFTVPSGPESGAIMIIDDVSIVSISYQPEEPFIETAETDYYDDFSFNTGYWDYQGVAYRDATNDYLVLNSAQSSTWGHVWLKNPVRDSFKVSFKYKAGNGERSGADGLALLFYQERSITAIDRPQQTSNVVGAMLSGAYSTSGYGIEFDNYQNSIDVSGNHVALRGAHSEHLAVVDFLGTEDFLWHDVYIEVGESSVSVYVDGSQMINWAGTIDRTSFGLGIGAACGADTNWAIIDDVSIEIIDD
jgi:hypothetical protein